mmetsp:Transcript_75965/g.246013  ORF Transcript_75965/g.246013 Transcript_75965/m.246013 type:complete len:407 (-) Transcript_75965:153-1373(-)
MTLDPIALTMRVLSELGEAELLPGHDVEELQSEERVIEAMQVAMEAEVVLRRAGEAQGAPPAVPPAAWLWALELDAGSCEALWQLWGRHEGEAPGLQRVAELHVTLLYLGGGSDAEVAARHPELGGPEAVARLRADLQNREGAEVAFEVSGLAWDGRIAAAEVAGLSECCGNVHPHVTLAHADLVAPRVSSELLARKAAEADLQAGLGLWLRQLGLGGYTEALLEWCQESGAATTEEVSANAADAAAAAENRSEEQRQRVAEVLARAAASELPRRHGRTAAGVQGSLPGEPSPGSQAAVCLPGRRAAGVRTSSSVPSELVPQELADLQAGPEAEGERPRGWPPVAGLGGHGEAGGLGCLSKPRAAAMQPSLTCKPASGSPSAARRGGVGMDSSAASISDCVGEAST